MGSLAQGYQKVPESGIQPSTAGCVQHAFPLGQGQQALKRLFAPLYQAATNGYNNVLYRWTYNNARVHFDEARKLAQGVGVELTELRDRGGLVHKQKEFISVPGPAERGPELEKAKRFTTMIDALHYALYLWSKNDLERLTEHLEQTYGANETFWKVAQAISEVLPGGNREKQWLQGLLYGRRTYTQPSTRQLCLLDQEGEG
ncbi:MAG: hypothetical protein QXE29_05850 [Candidatus Hadarchaeales archaeon]